jgi:hypothetical protein
MTEDEWRREVEFWKTRFMEIVGPEMIFNIEKRRREGKYE